MTNNFKFDEEDLAKAIASEDESDCDISAGVQCSATEEEWLDIYDDMPGWKLPSDRIAVIDKNGNILEGDLLIADTGFNGEDEYPIFEFKDSEGKEYSFFDFEKYKFLTNAGVTKKSCAKYPWPDFNGNDIYEGDVIQHPSGERGTVVFLRGEDTFGDPWKVDYGSTGMSALFLQIGERGRAVVVKPSMERNRIENIDDKYLDGLSAIGADEYDRLFRDAASRAVTIYREWNKITDALSPSTSYFYEVESCIIDAVHCGLQKGLRIQVPLVSEEHDL
jgi:hypothetical protein